MPPVLTKGVGILYARLELAGGVIVVNFILVATLRTLPGKNLPYFLVSGST